MTKCKYKWSLVDVAFKVRKNSWLHYPSIHPSSAYPRPGRWGSSKNELLNTQMLLKPQLHHVYIGKKSSSKWSRAKSCLFFFLLAYLPLDVNLVQLASYRSCIFSLVLGKNKIHGLPEAKVIAINYPFGLTT